MVTQRGDGTTHTVKNRTVGRCGIVQTDHAG